MRKYRIYIITLVCVALVLSLAAQAGALDLSSSSDKSGGFSLSKIFYYLFVDKIMGFINNLTGGTYPSGDTGSSGDIGSDPSSGWDNSGNTDDGTKPVRTVVGFYTPGGQSSFASYGGSLTSVAPAVYSINSYGTVQGNLSSQARATAQQKNVQVLALVQNMSNGNFSRTVAHSILSNSTTRAKAVNNLYNLVSNNGYAGVNIDFEDLSTSDRWIFSSFIKELKKKFSNTDHLVTVSVPAKTYDDPKHGWSGAYDYETIGSWADQVMIMAYDENYSTGKPGPVASIGWVSKVLKYTATEIPRSKIVLGIATYGYDWPKSGGKASALAASTAKKNAGKYGADIQWDNSAKVPHYTYKASNGKWHEVWFEDSQSLTEKLSLVNSYGIKGIALWKVGLEDSSMWSVINQKFTVAKLV